MRRPQRLLVVYGSALLACLLAARDAEAAPRRRGKPKALAPKVATARQPEPADALIPLPAPPAPEPASGPAVPEEALEVPEAEEQVDPLLRPSLHGFVRSRSSVALVDTNARLYGVVALPPSPRAFVQANVQPQLRTRGDHASLSADISLIGSTVAPHGLLLFNELYAEGRLGPLRVLVGRKRVVWGSGVLVNPTDVLNPPKDPLNPELQRTGALLLPMFDVTVGPAVFSLAASVAPKTTDWGIPNGLDVERVTWAARAYVLLWGTDLNLIYARDEAKKRHLVGLSISRFLNDWIEVHAEGMVKSGAPEAPPFPHVPGCGEPPAERTGDVTAVVLLGARLDFDHKSALIVEYLYDGNGTDGARFDDLLEQAPCIAQALAAYGATPTFAAPKHPVGFPTEPVFLARAHHLLVRYQRPHLTEGLLEDVSIAAGAVFSPADLSAILQAEVGYSFAGRATVGLRLMVWAGTRRSEAGAWPGRVLGQADVRVAF